MPEPRVLMIKTGTTDPAIAAQDGDYDDWFRGSSPGDIQWTQVDAFRGEALPPAEGFDGVLVTGSPLSVRDEAPWMGALGQWMLQAAEAHVPVLAVCFGHQLVGEALGGRVVDVAPREGPYLVFTDRCWFTAETLRLLLAAGPGRLHVDDAEWWESVGPLQDVPAPGVMELALHPGGDGEWRDLAPVTVDLGLQAVPDQQLPEALSHAGRTMKGGAAAVHQVHHWSHLVRCSLFAILAQARQASLDFERAGWPARIRTLLRILWAARSFRLDRLAAAVSDIHPSASVHPTAVIEASVIGPRARIGAHTVIRASVIGEDARVDEHSLVQMSAVGARARVGRQAMLTALTLMDGAFISGGGYQASIIGRDAFVAWGTVMLDMSMGSPVKVEHAGERVSSGHHFLGSAIGHRVRIGNGVRLNHGLSVPNDAVIIAPGEHLLRHWDGAPVDQGPLVVVDGRPRPLKAP